MIDQIEHLLADYRTWLRDRTRVKEVGGWFEITTPYLDRHNDFLQIYARRDDEGSWALTDDGYVIADLESSGCDLHTPKRQAILRETLNGFGVRLDDDDRLVVHASEGNFPIRKHSLVQAMLAIGDMFQLAQATVVSLFQEDVARWMTERDVRYTANVRISGKSGYDQNIDFIIPRSKRRPERFVNAINNPTKDRAQSKIFAWTDIREFRPEAVAYAFINDSGNRPVPPGVIEALLAYDITPVIWSQRESVAEDLAA